MSFCKFTDSVKKTSLALLENSEKNKPPKFFHT